MQSSKATSETAGAKGKPASESKPATPKPEGESASGSNEPGGESAPAKSKVETLADMFRNDAEPSESEAGEAETQAPESGAKGKPGESHKGPPKALKDLAERLGVAPEALYKVAIPLGNGKTLTLGEMKDAADKQGDFAVRELAFEERRSQSEGELMRSQAEVRELLQALPREAVKPEVLEAVRKRHETRVAAERRLTLEAISEWSDDKRREADMSGMVDHLKGYGLPANYLAGIYDHRVIRYIRENWLREERLKRALAMVERDAPDTPTRSRPNGKPPSKPDTEQKRPRVQTHTSRLLDILDQ